MQHFGTDKFHRCLPGQAPMTSAPHFAHAAAAEALDARALRAGGGGGSGGGEPWRLVPVPFCKYHAEIGRAHI